ncbi:MAG: response regulator [Hyphomicrobiales bacterium]|nr:response regulator [Hyphomicrobiales bacterium]
MADEDPEPKPTARKEPPVGRAEPLRSKRVLIVEDEFFVAMQIEQALQSFGCRTVGPFTTLELALQASQREQFEAAVLDINLNRTMVYPLADELAMRGIPFVFLSGYAAHDLPDAYKAIPRVQKPFNPEHIRAVLEQALGAPN